MSASRTASGFKLGGREFFTFIFYFSERNHRSQKVLFAFKNFVHSQYDAHLSYTLLGFKDIGFRKSEFVTMTHFLCIPGKNGRILESWRGSGWSPS